MIVISDYRPRPSEACSEQMHPLTVQTALVTTRASKPTLKGALIKRALRWVAVTAGTTKIPRRIIIISLRPLSDSYAGPSPANVTCRCLARLKWHQNRFIISLILQCVLARLQGGRQINNMFSPIRRTSAAPRSFHSGRIPTVFYYFTSLLHRRFVGLEQCKTFNYCQNMKCLAEKWWPEFLSRP